MRKVLLAEVLDTVSLISMKWHSHFSDFIQIEKAAYQNSGTIVDLTV